MTDFCSYHPTQPAWWHCNRCDKFLCPQCIIHRKGGFRENENYFLCPKCTVLADKLPIENIVKPFWKRLHTFFAYPFSSIQSILLIFILALFSALFSRPGLFTSLLSLIPWAIMLKYSYEALRMTSEGRLTPPPISSNVLGDNIGIVFKQIALIIALLLVYGFFIARLGPFAWLLYALCVLICLPSMIIILAINDNLGQALNPVYFIGMAVRIGWGYLLLFFFLSILFSAPSALGYSIIRFFPEPLQVYIWMAAKNYYTLVSYHLMGYVIIQYHNRLNHEVDMEIFMASVYPAGLPSPAKKDQAAASTFDLDLLNEISPLIQEGNLDKAIAVIQQRTNLDISDRTLSDRYLNLLKMRNRKKEFLEYAPRHLDLLAISEEKAKAMSLYLQCIKANAQLPVSPTTLFKIGTWFNEKGEAKLAVHTLNKLAKAHPKDLLAPKAYYRTAQILHEKLTNTEMAKKVLNALIAKYPDHDMAGFARNYLKSI